MAAKYKGIVTPSYIIIGLLCFIVILSILIVTLYCYLKLNKKQKHFYKVPSVKKRPSLKVKIPARNHELVTETEEEKLVPPSSSSYNKATRMVRIHSTPVSPTTPFISDNLSPYTRASLENVYIHEDRDANDLWKLAVKKANASQMFSARPKNVSRSSQCANGKVKFFLLYNKQGQKELIVKILEFVDLPLSRETGYTIPFVKVYLYPQAAHSIEGIKSSCCVETMSFPQENNCSFLGYPYDKLCACALKFVILDYDRFSRSEFVAECVTQLDEVSLEGETITRHLSIQRINREKDLGSLLLSLCYQPNASRMCIIVLKASGFPDIEGGHVSDHYVKISLMRAGSVLEKRRTKTIKKSLCPVFNEMLTFPIDGHGVRTLVLVFDIIRCDSKIKHEKIGTVVLGNHTSQRQVTPHEIQHFNEMLTSPHRQIAEWHKLVESIN